MPNAAAGGAENRLRAERRGVVVGGSSWSSVFRRVFMPTVYLGVELWDGLPMNNKKRFGGEIAARDASDYEFGLNDQRYRTLKR